MKYSMDFLIQKHPYLMAKLPKYTLREVSQHNSSEDGWVIIRGYVYDITPILSGHNPGILTILGSDGTEVFKLFHGRSGKVKRKLKRYLIGRVYKDKPHKKRLRLSVCCKI